MLSASFAVLFFILTILLVTQVAAHLLAASRLQADADHAARMVASTSSLDGIDTAVAEQARWLRTHHGNASQIDVTVDTAGVVHVVITARSPARAAGVVANLVGLVDVHAEATARVERLRS